MKAAQYELGAKVISKTQKDPQLQSGVLSAGVGCCVPSRLPSHESTATVRDKVNKGLT